MGILITGSNGFIGSQISATLLAEGHELVFCVRNQHIITTQERFPDSTVISCNFNEDINPDIWLPRLKNIDAIVNCVGIFQGNSQQSIENIHNKTPRALFTAAEQCRIQRIIHISALGVETGNTPYAQTKKAADEFLLSRKVNAVILRPSLVYGANSYGGSSLLRALASLPLFLPIAGNGQQRLQPIHIEDLAHTVAHYLKNVITRGVVNVVGPEELSLETLLIKWRYWLGFGKAYIWHVPLILIKFIMRIGDYVDLGPMNSTMFTMLKSDNIADPKPYFGTLNFKPRGFTEGLRNMPSTTQDHWYARLYFLKPLLILTLGLFWIISGIIPLTVAIPETKKILLDMGIVGSFVDPIRYTTSLLDIFLGITTLTRWHLKWISGIQFFVVLIYTLIATFYASHFWLDPLGSLLKNIPILTTILMMIAIAEDR